MIQELMVSIAKNILWLYYALTMIARGERSFSIRNKKNKTIFNESSTIERSASPMPIFTESLQFICKYKEKVSVDDVLTAINTPGYGILSLYFGLKLLDIQPEIQQNMLEDCGNAFVNGLGYDGAIKVVENLLKSAEKADLAPDLTSVSPKPISRIALWGPRLIEDRGQKVLSQVRMDKKVPVIIAYGGLCALKPAIEQAEIGDKLFIVFPKKIGSENVGYSIIKSDSAICVEWLDENDFKSVKSVVLIDDTTSSGATFQAVSEIFPDVQLATMPLFRS